MTQRILLLYLQAPLMSFGGTRVDHHGVTNDSPGLSLITGLLANALGYAHADWDATQRLQERLSVGVRRDRRGELLVDYQTVDLGQDHLVGTGWTTKGRPEMREGANSERTHIRRQHYLVDAAYVLAVELKPPTETPTLADLEEALRVPKRPLFLGRKTCLPASPVCIGMVDAPSLEAALRAHPRVERADEGPLKMWLPCSSPADEATSGGRILEVADMRDWQNQIHVGRRWLIESAVHPETPS